MLLLLLAACHPTTELSFVLVDGGSVQIPVQVANFAGVTVAGDPDYALGPVDPVPLWMPLTLTVPAGSTDAVTLTFGEDALRLRGETSGGTPFSLRVSLDSLGSGPADLDAPATLLVLDASKLLDGAALDALAAAADPDPDDGTPFALDLDATSDTALAFAAAAPNALWSGSPAAARTRFAGRWPYPKNRFRPEQSSGCGCAGTAGSDTGADWVFAPDTAVPDSGTRPADSAWATGSGGGCGGSDGSGSDSAASDSVASDSTSADSAASDSGDGGDGGCACGGGGTGDDTATDSARRSAAPGVVFALALGVPLVGLRRRR